MLQALCSLSFPDAKKDIISAWEGTVLNLIHCYGIDYCFDGNKFVAFKDKNSNQEYGLGRISSQDKVREITLFSLLQYGLDEDEAIRLSEKADILFFGEVDEHIDDCGERYLLVLRAPNGFELNTEDEDGDLYSDPIFSNQLYLFNESLPHSVTRYSFMESKKDDREKDFCIAINIPTT